MTPKFSKLEDVWGMDIYARDDDGGEEQDNASADIVHAYNTFGVTELCIGIKLFYTLDYY